MKQNCTITSCDVFLLRPLVLPAYKIQGTLRTPMRRFKAWCVKIETWSLKNARGDNFKIPLRLEKSYSYFLHIAWCWKGLLSSKCTVFHTRAWYANANKLYTMGEVNSILPHSHHMNLSWSWRREDEHFSCKALNVELVKILLTVLKVSLKILTLFNLFYHLGSDSHNAGSWIRSFFAMGSCPFLN